MSGISRSRSWGWLLLFLASITLQFVSGLADDSKSSKDGAKRSRRSGTKVLIVLLGIGVIAGFAFLLFKLWQKKKRDEQYARLLKLFEEDDELEVELGLRD